MKMLAAVLSLTVGAGLFAWTAPAIAKVSGTPHSKVKHSRQPTMLYPLHGSRPDYYEQLIDKHPVGSSLWWELKRRNVR